MLASIPVFIAAASVSANNSSTQNGTRTDAAGDILLVTGGVLLGGAGLGLIIPGGILRHKYQSRLLNHY